MSLFLDTRYEVVSISPSLNPFAVLLQPNQAAAWFGWSNTAKGFNEGLMDTTSYRVSKNKLILEGTAGWIQAYRMVCDAVIQPRKRLELRNCFDDGVDPSGVQQQSTPVEDHTFAFNAGTTTLQ